MTAPPPRSQLEKRYQVFVSSTYEDLRIERAEVMQALLELDCMPAGMELFPAATEEQWSWITRVIDESDYYLVIVGGRYGSVHPERKLSFTELEYRYAVDVGKPVIAFLHGSPSEIPSGKSERDPELLSRLLQFRQFCQQRLCKYWDNPADLGGKVSRSMTQLMKRHPATGWIRADAIGPETRLAEIELREELARLREELSARTLRLGTELSSGEDVIVVNFHFETKVARVGKTGSRYWVIGDDFWHAFDFTWNSVLRVLGALLLIEPLEHEVMQELNSFARHRVPMGTEGLGDDKIIHEVRISHEDFNQIKIQLVALGMIELVRDGPRNIRWRTTEAGRQTTMSLTTIAKTVSNGPVKKRSRKAGHTDV